MKRLISITAMLAFIAFAWGLINLVYPGDVVRTTFFGIGAMAFGLFLEEAVYFELKSREESILND